VKDDPALPRVLLIGASISVYYTLRVRELLKRKANVHRITGGAGDTVKGLRMLNEWLGDSHWDVIHFNFGLWDVKRGPDDKLPVSIEDYERNLREIVRRLRQTKAKLIWESSTPVPPLNPTVKSARRRNSDVIAYNAVAAKVMAENGIPIDDLYSFVLPRLQELQIPFDAHFRKEGNDVLASHVAASILEALASKPSP
jgi:acyl-CoA thioesterase-1